MRTPTRALAIPELKTGSLPYERFFYGTSVLEEIHRNAVCCYCAVTHRGRSRALTWADTHYAYTVRVMLTYGSARNTASVNRALQATLSLRVLKFLNVHRKFK